MTKGEEFSNVQSALVSRCGGDKPTPTATLEFDINKSGGSSLGGAVIIITYNGESQTKTADGKGLAVFYEIPQNTNINYTVTASGYNTSSGSLIIEGLDYYTQTVEMQASVPTTETVLFSSGGNQGVNITIPDGVTVLKVYYEIQGESMGHFAIYNTSSAVRWVNNSYEISDADTVYIGVTPGKTYPIYFDLTVSDGNGYPEYTLSYSQSINQHATDVNDY